MQNTSCGAVYNLKIFLILITTIYYLDNKPFWQKIKRKLSYFGIIVILLKRFIW